MVLTGLRRWASSRPHVLLIEVPGGVGSRLAVERICRERGWPLAATPADADLLVVAGPAGPVDPYLDRLWDQLPGPRARLRVPAGQNVTDALDSARTALVDLAAAQADSRPTQRPKAGMPTGGGAGGHDMGEHDAGEVDDAGAGHEMSGGSNSLDTGHDVSTGEDAHAGHDMGGQSNGSHGDGPDAPAPDMHAGHGMTSSGEDADVGHDMSGMDMSGPDMGGHDMGGHDMGGMDMSGPDMGGHGGHDMGGMDMPAALGMADRADDRDGLKLDILTVPWGPALPWWPAGLVVTTVLQGDVVQEVRAEQLAEPGAGAEGWRRALAGLTPAQAAVVVRLDALARLLVVAGWDAARLDAERLRDEVLGGADPSALTARLHRLTHRVGRSRVLRRMSSGLPVGDGDVVTTYRRWLQDVDALADGTEPPSSPEPAGDSLALLTASLVGLEFGSARLVVASLEPQLSGALRSMGAGV